MRKGLRKRLMTFALVGALAFMPMSGRISRVSADEDESSEETIEEIEAKKAATEQKIKDAEGKLEELQKNREDVSFVVSQLDEEIGEYVKKIDELNITKTQLQAEIAVTELKIQNTMYEEQLQYDNMKERIQYAYENGDEAYIDALMNVDDYKNMLNNSEYASQISEYDQKQLNKLCQIRDSIGVYKNLLKEKLEKVEEVKAESEAEQEALQVMMDGKRQLLGEYDSQIYQTEGEISDLQAVTEAFDAQILQIAQAAAAAEEARRQEEERRRQEEEERRRQEEEEERRRREKEQDDEDDDDDDDDDYDDEDDDDDDDDPPIYYTGGDLRWPMPSSDYISSYYGGRSAPVPGASTYHQAIDIGCSMYSEVVSSESGTVTATGYNEARGYYIIVYHGNNISTLYQHLSSFAVGNGEYVSRGQVIAYSGMTGYASGPHLHYEVIVDGERVDPLIYTNPSISY